PGLHFVDTAAKVSGVYDTVEPKVFFNPYAAVPSMHVGWVLLMGLALWRFFSPPPVPGARVGPAPLLSLPRGGAGEHHLRDARSPGSSPRSLDWRPRGSRRTPSTTGDDGRTRRRRTTA